jgi:hypothetical protein
MENYSNDIEAYLDKRMSDAERKDFEAKLQTDSSLQQELEAYRNLRTDLAYLHATRNVAAAALWRKVHQMQQKRRIGTITGLLALLLTIGFFGWEHFWRKSTAVESSQQVPPSILPRKEAPPINPAPPTHERTPPAVKPLEKSQPIAGNLKSMGKTGADIYRDLPKEPIAPQYRTFFEDHMKTFKPMVAHKAPWSRIVTALEKGRPRQAYALLKNMPSENDTTIYLQAASALLLQRPAAAESLLYPLITNKKWETEGRYLLIWVYLLQGNETLASAALKLLPDDYRDKKSLTTFLER